VVIPCRADGEVLARMLESLAGQWHRPDEVVVVRDGPDARCDEAVQTCGIKGARLIAGDWGHAGRARNAGIAAATGDVVIVADADARLAPELCAQVVAAFERGATWGMPRLAADGTSWLAARWVSAMNLAARLLPLPYGTCLFATREALRAVGGYHSELTWGEDTEIGLRLARRERCYRIRAAATYSSRRFRGRDARELGLRVWRAMRAVGHVLRASRLPREPLEISEALAFTREGETGS
jgi:glycosyltransferase involved in cell wall biosynthesis